MNWLEFFQGNLGYAMPLLIAAAIAGALMMERGKALLKTLPLKNTDGFFDKIRELMLSGETDKALALCERYNDKPVARVVKSGLVRAHMPEELIENGLELELSDSTQKIQKRTNYLATIANVATLLGLFGTIAGLVHSFQAVGHADAQQKSTLLANGIATALNTTMLGIAIAIPCMMAFSFLMGQANKLMAELENAATKTLDIIKQSYFLSYEEVEELNSMENIQSAEVTPIKSAKKSVSASRGAA
jgi:biopolymer transport protein ExbB/TolQ